MTVTNAALCWDKVKNLNRGEKIRLIAMLSNSLLHEKHESHKISAKQFYGIWRDEDYVDADKLNDLIKEGRKFKDDIEPF